MKLTLALILLLAIAKLSSQNEGIVTNETLLFVNQTIPSDTYYNSLLYSFSSLLEDSNLNNSILYGINTSVIDSSLVESSLALRRSFVLDSSLINSYTLVYQSILRANIDGGTLQLNSSGVGQSQISSCRVLADNGHYINETTFNQSNVSAYNGFIDNSNFFQGRLELNTPASSDDVVDSLELELTILDLDHSGDDDFILNNQDRNPRLSYVLNSEFSGFMTLSANSVSAHNNSFYAVYLYAVNSSITENYWSFAFPFMQLCQFERNYVDLAAFGIISTSKIYENTFQRSHLRYQDVQSRNNMFAINSGVQANNSVLDSDTFVNSFLNVTDSRVVNIQLLNSTINATNSDIVRSPITDGFANITNSTISSAVIYNTVVVVNYSTVRDIIFQFATICNRNSTFSGIRLQGSQIYDYNSNVCRNHYSLEQQKQIEREVIRRQWEEKSKENVPQEEQMKIMNLE